MALATIKQLEHAAATWVANTPAEFPENWDNCPANHNALIGITQHDTLEAALDVLLIEGMIIDADQGKFQLDQQQSFGLCHILANLSGALDFEIDTPVKIRVMDRWLVLTAES